MSWWWRRDRRLLVLVNESKADDTQAGDVREVNRQQYGVLDFIGGTAIADAMKSKAWLDRYLRISRDGRKWLRLLLIFWTVAFLMFGAGVASAVMFAGLEPVAAVLIGLASATGITFVSLLAILMAAIKKGFSGGAERLRRLADLQHGDLPEKDATGERLPPG
jgi:hypothetical protein